MAVISPTRPTPTPQGDGSWAQWLNCVLACGTMLMHRASVGLWRIGPARLRSITGDNSGGVSLGQMAEAVAQGTRGPNQVLLDPRYGLRRGELQALVASGRAALVTISCRVTVNTTRRTNSFTGSHGVFLNDYEWMTGGRCACERETEKQHGEYVVEDPGTTAADYKRWSADLVYRAAEANGGGGSGDPVIAAAITRDTEGVWREARKSGVIRSRPTSDSTSMGRLTKDRRYFVTETRDGGAWRSDTDGQIRHNWQRIRVRVGVYGWTKGENLR